MSVLRIPIVHAHDVSKQIPRGKNFLRDFLHRTKLQEFVNGNVAETC